MRGLSCMSCAFALGYGSTQLTDYVAVASLYIRVFIVKLVIGWFPVTFLILTLEWGWEWSRVNVRLLWTHVELHSTGYERLGGRRSSTNLLTGSVLFTVWSRGWVLVSSCEGAGDPVSPKHGIWIYGCANFLRVTLDRDRNNLLYFFGRYVDRNVSFSAYHHQIF